MNEQFPKLLTPTVDFQAVRDRRRTLPMHWDIDLSTARSLTAGTALTLPIAGTIIYADQLQTTGVASVHFVDETFSAGNCPVSVFAGIIFKVPFTQLIIENAAQAGKTLRIIFGVDIDFLPGTGAGVSVTNPINVLDAIDVSCRSDNVAVGTVVGVTVQTIIAPATNVRGVRLRHLAQLLASGAGGNATQQVIAKPGAAPVAIASQNPGVQLGLIYSLNAAMAQQSFQVNRLIPAGWGVYAVGDVQVAVAASDSCYLSYEVL